jgi:hypothetical protein
MGFEALRYAAAFLAKSTWAFQKENIANEEIADLMLERELRRP